MTITAPFVELGEKRAVQDRGEVCWISGCCECVVSEGSRAGDDLVTSEGCETKPRLWDENIRRPPVLGGSFEPGTQIGIHRFGRIIA
jgi:hypothetical protein